MLISFNNIIPYPEPRPLTDADALIQIMPKEIKEQLSQITLYRQDIPGDDLWNWNNLINNNFHPAFRDTYLNIITETDCKYACLSEKTFKPLASGQLFTFSSATGSLAAVKKFGFDTFDDVLDPAYDSILDLYSRIDSMIKLVNDVYADIEYLYEKNQQRILFNQQRLWSDELANSFINPLADVGVF